MWRARCLPFLVILPYPPAVDGEIQQSPVRLVAFLIQSRTSSSEAFGEMRVELP